MGLLQNSIIVLFIGQIIWYYITRPGPNGLGFLSTSKEAVFQGYKLENKNIIITGGHSGIGRSTVEALAPFKPNIWILARSHNNGIERCNEVAEEVKKEYGNPNIFCEEIDFSSLDSVVAFSNRWISSNRSINLLILNAATPPNVHPLTQDGFQLIWQTNYLGPFLLANLLLDNLKLGKPCRVVVLSSVMYQLTDIIWDDISGYNTWYPNNKTGITWMYYAVKAYSQSKTACILMANKLNEVLNGYGVANSVDPGMIRTPFIEKSENPLVSYPPLLLQYFIFKTVSQGASTTVYVSTAPELENIGGEFFENCNIGSRFAYAKNKDNDQKLWDISLKMVEKWLPKKQ